MTDQPLLGVALIVRDAADTIEKCLRSIEGAFDEIVVVDTGSVDDTRELVARALGVKAEDWEILTPGMAGLVLHSEAFPRIVLAKFSWVDDFSAARNYSFGLLSSKWRGYLDADDIFPLAGRLRPTLQRTEQVSPQSNCIALPYDYADGEMMQDKFRFVRWADGWRWSDEIHEYLIREPAGPRVISKYDDLTVIHTRPDKNTQVSLERNIRICTAVRDKAAKDGDTRKVGLMSYYLGQYSAAIEGCEQDAIKYLEDAVGGLGDNNLGCDARVSLARTYLTMGDKDNALRWASLAAGRSPEFPEGHLMLGIVLEDRGEHEKAAAIFDHALKLERPQLQSSYDVVFMQGVALSVAARTYAAVGRYQDALNTIGTVPVSLRQNPRVRPALLASFVDAWKSKALSVYKAMWEFYIESDEAPKALRLLDHAPAMIAESAEVKRLREFTEFRLRHVDDFKAYQECYNHLRSAAYQPDRPDVEDVRRQGRMVEVRMWAESLPKDGPTINLLAIGPQDCILEKDLLAINPRFHVTLCDVSDLAVRAMNELRDSYPDRVVVDRPHDYYDWPTGPFDVITCFEVIEHLPDQVFALREMRDRLARGGTLFLSTPVAGFWSCREALSPDCIYDWFGHLHSNSKESLTRRIEQAGLGGNLSTTDDGEFFFACLTREA